MSVTELAIKRPLLITVIFFALVLFGFIGYDSLNYNMLPNIDVKQITVQTVYKGASSDEIQSTITKPIEDAVSSIEGVDLISSASQEGISFVTIQLKPGTNTVTAQRDAERMINQIRITLPKDASDPVVNRFSTDDLPVMRFGVYASKLSAAELYDLVDQKIKPLLSNVDGVGMVSIIGGSKREIQIALDKDELQAYHVSPSLINQLVTRSNSSYPAGNVETFNTRYTIRMDAKITKVAELRNLVIRENKNGSRVYLHDVASITDAQADPTTINRVNGKPGIGIQISKQTDANSVNVSNGVRKELEEIKGIYKDADFGYDIASDQSVFTLASVSAVQEDLVLAVIIVATVMLFFLHSFRSSTFVLIALPSAMIPTFALIYAFGFSLNLMSLMALSLVVGILVDDSIVVLENIYRHLSLGKPKVQAAIEGRSEIGFTAISITLVDVVVFLPMSLAGGIIGSLIREFSLVVVFSTLLSLLVSFTLTPLMAAKWGRLESPEKKNLWGKLNLGFEKLLDSIKEEYGRLLRWSLGHKKWILATAMILFIGSIALIPTGFVGTAFRPVIDIGEFNLKLELASQASLYETNQTVKQAEQILLSKSEVVDVFSNVGTQTGHLFSGSDVANFAEISVKMVDKKERNVSDIDFGNMMRDEIITKIPGAKVTIIPTDIAGSSSAPIQIAVKGTDMDEIWKEAKMVRDAVAQTPGTDYVQFSTRSPKSEIIITLDREEIANLGLSVDEIGSAVQYAFRGNDQSRYKDKGEEYPINIILERYDRQDIDDVKSFAVLSSRGANIPLGEIAAIREAQGQSVLERSGRLNSITVSAAAVGRPVGTIVDEVKQRLSGTKLPEAITIDYQGEAQRQSEAFGSLGMAMLIGFLLVYLSMVALYESVVYPFVVMFSVPLAMVGALLALALTMQPLAIFSLIGMIMLMGLVAKNGILLVDFTNHLKQTGLPVTEALVEAGKIRLRPILMTTVAMIFGMLPLALSRSAAAEIKNGMAWVVIGGLTSSLLLTLLVVPTVYIIVDTGTQKVAMWFRTRRPVEIDS